MNFDNDNFIHITDTIVYLTYLDGNTLRNKLLGTAKSAMFEKIINYKYKSVIGGQGKPNVIIPALKIVKGSIDKFVVSSESFDVKPNSSVKKHVSFYNMMQGFKVGYSPFPEFNQYERSINLTFIHTDFNKTFQTTINGVHATAIKRSFDEGFLVERFEFIGYDMIDEVI